MRDERESIREEERAAAEEARRLGGRSGMDEVDEAERAAAEHGGGEAEGFEEAEELLAEHASHEERGGDPLADAGEAEVEEDPSVHGEPDEPEPRE